MAVKKVRYQVDINDDQHEKGLKAKAIISGEDNTIKGVVYQKPTNKVCKIATWKPTSVDDIKVNYDGGLFICYFNKVIENNDISIYNKFIIKKNSYENQLPIICQYINFFIKYYDTENELMTAYFKLKYTIDKDKDNKINENNYQLLIHYIYKYMFTPTMVDKICRMVEDNYIDDIELGNKSNKEKKHLESLEFKNIHIKILLRISFAMRCMAPILFHFLAIKTIKINKDSDLIFNFYKDLFKILSIDTDGINMYNKLYTYIKTKVAEDQSHNQPIYQQREILGQDMNTVADRFMKHTFVSENIVKYKFPNKWIPHKGSFEESIVGFNKTVLKFQLDYYRKEQLPKTHKEVTSDKTSDGLSGMDKLEMNIEKIDEGKIIFTDININTQIKFICDKYKVEYDNYQVYNANDKPIEYDISYDEIKYYMDNWNYSNLQLKLIKNLWAKYFGSFQAINMLCRKDYIILLLITKNLILYNDGIDINSNISDEVIAENAPLAAILTGNIDGNTNNRTIKNEKFIKTVKASDDYKHLIKSKYSFLEASKENYIIDEMSPFINTKFTYLSYNNPEINGTQIESNLNKLVSDLIYIFKIT